MAENAPRVLVVDAERFFREAIREALLEAGIACETAESGESALAAAFESDFAVAVLDLGLADVTGIEVLKRLRESDPSLRVIVLSAQDRQDEVLEALRLDACDYLAKPLHDEELVLAVRRALRGHETESRWSTLRDRVCALDARVADLIARSRDASPGDRAADFGAYIAETVAVVLGAAKSSLMVMGEDGSLRVAAATGHDVALDEMDPVAPGEGVAGIAIRDGEPLVVGDVGADDRFAARTTRDRYRSKSLVVTPISAGGPPLGVLCATDREDGAPFGIEDLALLRILALHTAEILTRERDERADVPVGEASPEDSARDITQPLPYDVPEGTNDAELARSICEALTAEVDPDRLVSRVLRAVGSMLPAAPVGLYLIDNASGTLRLEGQVEGAGPAEREVFDRSSGLTGMVLQTGHLVATDHPDKDPRFDPDIDTPADGSIRPLVCVPVTMRGKTLGVLRAFPNGGTPASARTAEVLAAAISAAVRNVLLYRSLLESIDEVARVRRGSRGRP